LREIGVASLYLPDKRRGKWGRSLPRTKGKGSRRIYISQGKGGVNVLLSFLWGKGRRVKERGKSGGAEKGGGEKGS